MKKRKERKQVVNWFLETYNTTPRTSEKTFMENKDLVLSKIPEVEREYIWDWCKSRHLDDIFPVVALTYWTRARVHIAIEFLVKPGMKDIYMVICIHIGLKWLGYDEAHRCNFFKDLTDINEHLHPETHRKMEMDLLKALDWLM